MFTIMEHYVSNQEKEFITYLGEVESFLGYKAGDNLKNGFIYNAFIDGNNAEDTAKEIEEYV